MSYAELTSTSRELREHTFNNPAVYIKNLRHAQLNTRCDEPDHPALLPH